MELLPLISIPLIYFLVAFVKPYLQNKLPFNICAICIAVSATWAILLILWLTGSEIPLILIGILMGMSIAGTMYKMEAFYKKKNMHNFWIVRLVLIIGGFYAINELLKESWNFVIFILIADLFIIAIASLFQGTTHREVVKEQEQKGQKSGIVKRLDNCC